jgi:hypothetical protein
MSEKAVSPWSFYAHSLYLLMVDSLENTIWGAYSALLLLIFKSAFLDVVDPICRARHRRHCLTRLDSLSGSIHYFVGTIDAQKLLSPRSR